VVTGAVERFDSVSTWVPEWVGDVHQEPRERIRISDFLPLLRNLYTWNKLFRRDFFLQQGLWFREGVAYEDQPIITQLYARAHAIDVLGDTVYAYRARDDKSSISQQTASLTDLRHRVEAWDVTRRVLRAEVSPELYHGWLQTLFDAHFHWYLRSPGIVDDTYWAELVKAVRSFTADAPDAIWRAAGPARRVLITLAVQDRRDDAREFVSRGAFKTEQWPSRVADDGIYLELPLYDDPLLDPTLFRLDPDQLVLAHAIENLQFRPRDDGSVDCLMSGWAFVRKVDLTNHDAHVELVLRNERTGEETLISSGGQAAVAFPPPVDDQWCDYRPGTFSVDVPLSELLESGRPGDAWGASLRVRVAGFTVSRTVTRLVRSGSAGAIPAAGLPDGGRLIADWRVGTQLVFLVDHSGVHVSDLTLTGRTLSGHLTGDGAADIKAVTVSGPGGRPTAPVVDGRFTLVVPRIDPPAPGQRAQWTVEGLDETGVRRPLVPAARRSSYAEAEAGLSWLLVETDRNGVLVVNEQTLVAMAETVDVPGDQVRVRGRVLGPGVSAVRVRTRHKKAVSETGLVPVVDGRFEALLALRHSVFRFGERPLPAGDHDVFVVATVGSATHEVPLDVSMALGATLPVRIATDQHEGRVVRGPEAQTRITVQRPVGDAARGLFSQHSFRRTAAHTRRKATRRGLLVRSYFGELATDSGVSVQHELRRRGSDLPVYWAVQDHAVVVPDGGIPVIANSAEWYDLMGSVTYYLDNMFQPEFHLKPEGQVLMQTFHGYPFKQMGHPHWDNLGLSQALIDSYDRRASDWDYLISPATYATALLTRDFAYDGDVLEIGYPRNDVLLSPGGDAIREAVRTSLGLRPDQTAVLYAPTFRDYLSADDSRAVMPRFFDFVRAHERLGDDVVVLIRGHAFNARTKHRVGDLPGAVDVTDYPEVSDLYLAADAAIVDYSSLRFDFGVTGKPMIFHVPDLELYRDSRGWLFDFEPTAPGPLASTTDEVVDAILDLPAVARRHAAAYQRFRDDYLDLDDGRAAARLVDAVFVPRGDA
jgi:CDP-glycerol glycerophosphotransferase